MAQYVLINPVGTRYAGEVLDSVQDGQEVINQLAAFGGVLVPLPNALLQPYIDRCQSLILVGNYGEATAMMQAAYASSTAISGGGTAGTLPIWSAASALGDSAITQVAGAISSLSGLVGGAGYVQSAAPVALAGGTGTGATAGIVVSSGAVQWAQLLDPGQNYTAGDVLTISGGVGGTITVLAVVPKNSASGHVTAQRIGAGTTQPDAGLDSRFGAVFTGWQRRPQYISPTSITTADATMVRIGGNDPENIDASNATTLVGLGIFNRVSSSTARAVIGTRVEPQIVDSSGSTQRFSVIHNATLLRSSSTDTNTATYLRGSSTAVGHNNTAVVYTTPEVSGALITLFQSQAALSTITDSLGVRVQNTSSAASAGTFTNQSFFVGNFTNASSNVYTTHYGVRLPNATITAPGTRPVNYWGVSQEDTFAKNQFLGNVGVGIDPGAGKVIASLTLTNGGTGYTNGTYSQVALTTVTGTGTGATADIVVASGIVTNVVLRAPGQGYAVGDTLSCASIGAGASFLVTVATTASILRSDGTSVTARVGAGTTTPRAAVDAVGSTIVDGNDAYSLPFWSGLNVFSEASTVIGTASASPVTLSSGVTRYYGFFLSRRVNANASGSSFSLGMNVYSSFENSGAGVTLFKSAALLFAIRSYANDLATNANLTGCSAGFNIQTTVGSNATADGTGFQAQANNNKTTHVFTTTHSYDATLTNAGTIGTHTVVRARPATGGGTITTYYGVRIEATTAQTITNRWGISQEDAAANNVLAGKTAMGQAAGTAATAQADLGASTTAAASLRIRSGVAPTSPNDGDIWFDGTALRIRIAGVTRTVTVT